MWRGDPLITQTTYRDGVELEAIPAATPTGHGLVTSRGPNGILDYGQGGRSHRHFGQG